MSTLKSSVDLRSILLTIGYSLLQTVDRPKDWYKTMFKQIHMVHKPGMFRFLKGALWFEGGLCLLCMILFTQKCQKPSESHVPFLFSILPIPLSLLNSQICASTSPPSCQEVS